ncbi:MAG: DUF2071 domain-containing protein, partial [Chitinophagaceae bacterium]|nr:DUF2071 domain-containing protein [Chitinophagaceae bacterium]
MDKNGQSSQFLKAEWRKLVFANYVIDPAILLKYLPHGTELDRWANKDYVSLVGFLFNNTSIHGMRIPFHQSFQEINLRFYVRRKYNDTWRRGVVFIKEIVPKGAVTLIANSWFHEHYATMPCRDFQ